jgi:hypothetical protein
MRRREIYTLTLSAPQVAQRYCTRKKLVCYAFIFRGRAIGIMRVDRPHSCLFRTMGSHILNSLDHCGATARHLSPPGSR